MMAAAGLAASSQAQQPGPDNSPPQDRPPSPRPQESPRDKPQVPGPDAQRARSQAHGDSGDRMNHIKEAMKHLRAAGLGDMADRLEMALRHREHGHPGHRMAHRRGAHGGRPRNVPAPGQQHFRRPTDPGSSRGPAFAAPAPFVPRPQAEDGRRGPESRRDAGSNDDLRNQVQKLQREVEELKNLMKSRMEERRPESRRDEPRKEEPRKEEPRDERR